MADLREHLLEERSVPRPLHGKELLEGLVALLRPHRLGERPMAHVDAGQHHERERPQATGLERCFGAVPSCVVDVAVQDDVRSARRVPRQKLRCGPDVGAAVCADGQDGPRQRILRPSALDKAEEAAETRALATYAKLVVDGQQEVQGLDPVLLARAERRRPLTQAVLQERPTPLPPILLDLRLRLSGARSQRQLSDVVRRLLSVKGANRGGSKQRFGLTPRTQDPRNQC